MIEIDGATFWYRGIPAVAAVTARVAPGECVALLGANGSGKSTLLRMIAGQLRPAAGVIRIDGDATTALDRRAIARRIAYLPQKCESPPGTVFAAVATGRHPHAGWRLNRTDRAIVSAAIDRLGLGDLASRQVATLSGGEFQKVAIARALAQRAPILLLDEPTNHLDLRNQIEVMKAVVDLAREHGLTVVAVLHDANLALRFAGRAWMLHRGRLLGDKPMPELAADDLSVTYGIPIALHQVPGGRVAAVDARADGGYEWPGGPTIVRPGQA